MESLTVMGICLESDMHINQSINQSQQYVYQKLIESGLKEHPTNNAKIFFFFVPDLNM